MTIETTDLIGTTAIIKHLKNSSNKPDLSTSTETERKDLAEESPAKKVFRVLVVRKTPILEVLNLKDHRKEKLYPREVL